jgi:AcrR family transcriptional regulator
MARSSSRYHHGDLRRALFDALGEAVLEAGPAAVSLRDLARRAGVSHAAPAHHFGGKRGLLTAFAAEGHRLLAQALHAAAARSGGDFTDVGLAYISFALGHRAHFEVMFRPELLQRDDPELAAAMQASSLELRAGASEQPATTATADPEAVMIAAWSLVHGFATLWLSGNIPGDLGPADELARRVARVLDASSDATGEQPSVARARQQRKE